MKNKLNESLTDSKPLRLYHFWPMLAGPAAIVLVILARSFYSGFDTLDALLERIAPWILLLAASMYWIRCIVTRNPLYTIMTFIAATLLLRELHWSPTIKIAAYPVLVGCFVWMLVCRDLLARPFADRRHTIWLIAALATYILAQLVERRVFKFVPGEIPIHSKIEEAVELAAHITLAVASLVGNWSFYIIKQETCPLSEGFKISPTGKLWYKVSQRFGASRDCQQNMPADNAVGINKDEA